MKVIERRLAGSIAFAGVLTTFAITPMSNYDPISLVKMFTLTTLAFWCLGLVATQIDAVKVYFPKPVLVFLASFLFWMLFVVLFSDSPINQQIWGSFGRNTGALTYLSLTLLLATTISLSQLSSFEKIVKSFIFTSIPMTIYCIIQVIGKDPVSWSSFAPFGTLGNINFLSAFFGMTSTMIVILLFDSSRSGIVRFSLLVLVVVDLWITLKTGSIQGFMVFVAGCTVATFLFLYKSGKMKLLIWPFLMLVLVSSYLVVTGLFNKGPLARLLYQPSTTFRGDYMHAGWAMTLKFPVFGVGMDSYGDWYRQMRGLISTTRTNPERTANTAHNIFLDISSNGGFPLLFFFLAILMFALLTAIKFFRNSTQIDLLYLAVFSTWVAFVVQALISINQIGVGIWGWILTGVLIGYPRAKEIHSLNPKVNAVKGRKPKKSQELIPPRTLLTGVASLSLGAIAAFIPINADMKYFQATKVRALDQIKASTENLGATAFHRELALQAAMAIPAEPQAYEIAKDLVKKYPRSFFGWRVLASLSVTPAAEKAEALSRMRMLDPFNPNIPQS